MHPYPISNQVAKFVRLKLEAKQAALTLGISADDALTRRMVATFLLS